SFPRGDLACSTGSGAPGEEMTRVPVVTSTVGEWASRASPERLPRAAVGGRQAVAGVRHEATALSPVAGGEGRGILAINLATVPAAVGVGHTPWCSFGTSG